MTAERRGNAGVTYRRLLPSDDLNALTRLLHEAYAPLAAAGMHFVASHQDVETTRRRIARGETFVAVSDEVVVATITLVDAVATRGSPFYDRPDVAPSASLRFGQTSSGAASGRGSSNSLNSGRAPGALPNWRWTLRSMPP